MSNSGRPDAAWDTMCLILRLHREAGQQDVKEKRENCGREEANCSSICSMRSNLEASCSSNPLISHGSAQAALALLSSIDCTAQLWPLCKAIVSRCAEEKRSQIIKNAPLACCQRQMGAICHRVVVAVAVLIAKRLASLLLKTFHSLHVCIGCAMRDQSISKTWIL
jgi:hypothetical protein